MSTFSELQVKAAKALVNLYETGDLIGHYDALAILGDSAGISFGKTQTTENSGGLWKLIFEEYFSLSDPKPLYKADFEQYRLVLYNKEKDTGKKFALTHNDAFKDLLRESAQEDPQMRKAQDLYFHRNYFRPALQLASDYSITLPLILAMFYDFCIHSGPQGARKFVDRFDEGWSDPPHLVSVPEDQWTEKHDLEMEQAWGRGLIQSRHKWLTEFTSSDKDHQKVVRDSAYRTESMIDLLNRGLWNLQIPFVVTKSRREWSVTEEVLKNVW